MRSLREIFRLFVVPATGLVLFVLTVACDRPDAGTGRLEQLRCETDGVCWQPVGKRSLEGAYRKGDMEMKFDAVFSPSRSLMTQYKDEWSIRLIDHLGVAFFTAKSSNPPDGWSTGVQDQQRMPSDVHRRMEYLCARNEFAYEMAKAVVEKEPPTGSLRKPWMELCHYLQHQVIENDLFGSEAKKGLPEAPVTQAYAQNVEGPAKKDNQEPSADPPEEDKDVFSGEDFLDDAEEHEALAGGVAAEEGSEVDQSGECPAAEQTPPSLLTAFAFSRAKNGKVHPFEYVQRQDAEFQQDVDLYSKHTRSFLAFGWKTGKHHSAACIHVKERPLGSSEPWRLTAYDCTENHGSKAGEDNMSLYAVCRDMPVTKGYYVWKGECGGKFPSHYCNDDTALQIRHAHGIYDNGSQCLKRKRTHRPWCERPW